jgi:hypothetical protein
LYLRRVMFPEGYHYVLRESYSDGDCWKHRDLADLGVNPGECIEYAGRNGFYFSGDLEEQLEGAGVRYCSEDLECVFLPFLKPHVRRLIENFRAHSKRPFRSTNISPHELTQKQRHLHSFDKRRLHFLRCGRVDIGDLDRRPWGFLNVVAERSRDEIEQILEGMEAVLRPQEMRLYLFTALNLQAHFPHHGLRNNPVALDQEAVDNHFLEALCRVNSDAAFFCGTDGGDRVTLHPYLARYLILYFDSEFERPRWPEFMRAFAGRGRAHGRPASVQYMGMDDACRIFGVSREEVARMKDKELVRMYRRKAKELHPDRGGDKESFIRMGEAFACLMEKSRS